MDITKNMEFAKYMKSLREKKGLSALEVQVGCGVSQPYLSKIEKGYAIPSPQILKKLANFYNVPYHHLMVKAGYIEPDYFGQDSIDKDWPGLLNVLRRGAKQLTDEDKERIAKIIEFTIDYELGKKKEEE